MRAVIADLQIEFVTEHPFFLHFLKQYASDSTRPADITVRVTKEEVEKESVDYFKENPSHRVACEKDERFRMGLEGYLETIAAHRKLALELYRFDAFLLHASAICVDGKGICFCAQSGTGKTTHSRLWQEIYIDRFFYLNGDKPILRKKDGVYRIYGTPWAGKEGYQTNTSAPLHAICLLKRGKENEIHPIGKDAVFFGLMNQILHPQEEIGAMRTLDLLQEAIDQSKNFELHCNISQDAAVLAGNAIL